MQNFAIYDCFWQHQSHMVPFQFALCTCVCGVLSTSNWSQTSCHWACVSMGPATGASEHMQVGVGSLVSKRTRWWVSQAVWEPLRDKNLLLVTEVYAKTFILYYQIWFIFIMLYSSRWLISKFCLMKRLLICTVMKQLMGQEVTISNGKRVDLG